ncbi:MAG TPA: nuclear transport factor 2 family protein [Candidatus Tumulicola sp.]|nr:nuclear transport factor 2 family protein [Candidatus Tumulicola sp.]
MDLRTIVASLAFGFVLAPQAAAAANNTPPAPIVKLANAVVRAANDNDPAALRGIFAADAVVVDENPPFTWRGAGAGTAWWGVVGAAMRKIRMTHLRAVNVRISEFHQTATDAYMVQPMTITGIAGGKPFAESGTMTYTFHNAGGTWLISTFVWTTKP